MKFKAHAIIIKSMQQNVKGDNWIIIFFLHHYIALQARISGHGENFYFRINIRLPFFLKSNKFPEYVNKKEDFFLN